MVTKKLVTGTEICALYGLARSSFDGWRYKPDFPPPAGVVGHTYQYRLAEIKRWAKANNKPLGGSRRGRPPKKTKPKAVII